MERVGGREEQNQEEEEEGHRHEVRHQRRVPTGDFKEEKREGNVQRRGVPRWDEWGEGLVRGVTGWREREKVVVRGGGGGGGAQGRCEGGSALEGETVFCFFKLF